VVGQKGDPALPTTPAFEPLPLSSTKELSADPTTTASSNPRFIFPLPTDLDVQTIVLYKSPLQKKKNRDTSILTK
jgi:hypothetical protein